jgi:hypothetical protein
MAKRNAAIPDFAEFIIGRRFAPTRWLHPQHQCRLAQRRRHDSSAFMRS